MTVDSNRYNAHGVDITSLRDRLRNGVMLGISEPENGQGFLQIVIIQSILTDDDGNEYALSLDDTVIPVDLITAVQDPLPIAKAMSWAVIDK